MKRFRWILGAFLVIAVCASCQGGSQENKPRYADNEIGSLAYDVAKKENVVYLLESDEYVPYIVVTNDYNGYTLLLRKNVLDEPRRYNEYSAYYRDSEIDRFLNDDFLLTLDRSVQEIIAPVTVDISSKNNLGRHGEDVEEYDTRIFLLSVKELNYDVSPVVAPEGKTLAFFKVPQNRLTQNRYEFPCAYWTRSADTGYRSAVSTVSQDGIASSINSFDDNGVRPSFCVDGKLKIAYKEDAASGISGYFLTLDEKTPWNDIS